MQLNIRSPLNSLGYGVVGRNLVRSLNEIIDVTLFPIGQPQLESNEEAKLFTQLTQKQENFDYTAPSLTVWHQHSLAESIGKGKRCAMPIFELDKFTLRELNHLSSQDQLFVPSKWAQQVVNNHLRIATTVVPFGVDTSIFYSNSSQINNNTIFLNIGKFELRKGMDILIECFNKAFTKNDNVELWLMCHNPFLTEDQSHQWATLATSSTLGNKIKLLDRVATQREVAQIMNRVDCGVFLSHTEGWGLETLEMMACGKYVIATNYSGHTEFCTRENAMLVDIDELEEAYDGIWFFGQGNWAKIDESQTEQTIAYMRNFHELKQNGGIPLVNNAGIETAKVFSWENSANIISKEI